MTSFLPAFKPSGAFNTSSPQKFSSSANSSFKPVTTFIVPPLSPKQSQLNELLTKRNNTKDLGDLLAKKFKPINFSESGSIQGSPASKRKAEDCGSYQNTSPMTQGSPLNMKEIMRRINPIPSFDSAQGQFNGLRASNLFEDETENTLPVNSLSASSLQLQSALRTLEKKILIHEEIKAKSLKTTLEKRKIPPFPSRGVPVNIPKEDPNFIYGNVEFPFLSISAPFSELQQLNEKLLSEAKLGNISSFKKGAIEVEDVDLDKSSSSEDLLSSLLPTREETLRSETEETSIPKKKSTRKTNKTMEEEEKPEPVVIPVAVKTNNNSKKEKKIQEKSSKKSTVEKEKPQTKTIEEDEASLYRKPMYVFSNRSERQKSRWQSAQEEKLAKSGNVSDSDDEEELESVEVMFGGSKESQTPVGSQSQVDITMSTERGQREKPKMMWDPSSLDETELKEGKGLSEHRMNQEIRRQSIFGLSPGSLRSPGGSEVDLNSGAKSRNSMKILAGSSQQKNPSPVNKSPSPTPAQDQIQQSIANYLKVLSGSTLSEKFNAYAALPKIIKSGSVPQLRRSSMKPIGLSEAPVLKLSIPILDEPPSKREVKISPGRSNAKRATLAGAEFVPKKIEKVSPKVSAFMRSGSKELSKEKRTKENKGRGSGESSDLLSNLRTFRSKRPKEIEMEDNEKLPENTFQALPKLGVKEMAMTARFTFDTPKSSRPETEKQSRKEMRRLIYANRGSPMDDSMNRRDISVMARELQERWGIQPKASESSESEDLVGQENGEEVEVEGGPLWNGELEMCALQESFTQDDPQIVRVNNKKLTLLNLRKESIFGSLKSSRNPTPTHQDSVVSNKGFGRSQSRNDLEKIYPQTQKANSKNDLFTGTGTDFFKFNEDHILYQTFQNELLKESALTNRTEKRDIEKSSALMIAFNNHEKIIQPAFMSKIGSMCCSEFWPKKFHVMLYGKVKAGAKFLKVTKPDRENEALYRPKKWLNEKMVKGKLVEQASAWTSKAVTLAKLKEKNAPHHHAHPHHGHTHPAENIGSPKGSLHIPRLRLGSSNDTPRKGKDTVVPHKNTGRTKEKDNSGELDQTIEPHEKPAAEEKKEEEKLSHYERLKARRKKQELEDLLKLKIESNKAEIRRMVPLSSRNEDRSKDRKLFVNSCPITPRK